MHDIYIYIEQYIQHITTKYTKYYNDSIALPLKMQCVRSQNFQMISVISNLIS